MKYNGPTKFKITTSADENARALPTEAPRPGRESKEDCLLNFSYYTLCKISAAIGFTYPTPASMAMRCKEVKSDLELTLDPLGNFVSLLPKARNYANYSVTLEKTAEKPCNCDACLYGDGH